MKLLRLLKLLSFQISTNYPIFMKRSSVMPLKLTLMSYLTALQTQKIVMWERQ